MNIILDTGPLVAMLNRRDAFHRWSVAEAAKLKPPFYSCEAVLTEAHFLLRGIPLGTDRLLEFVGSGHLDLSFSYAAHHVRISELMRGYKNVPMSFADACLVRLTEEQRGSVFTLDTDFLIYRKHGRDKLDLIIP